MLYHNYALAGLRRRTKYQRAVMKIEFNHIMSWEVKDCCKNRFKSDSSKLISMFRLLIVLRFVIFLRISYICVPLLK